MSRATIKAEELRKDLGLFEKSETDLNFILERLCIRVRRVFLGEGVEGASKTEGLKHLIILSSTSCSEEKERFTIAHEIGHILIHHGANYCRKSDLNLIFTRNDREREANEFAEELLLPKREMIELLKDNDLEIKFIKNVAQIYKVSLSVAAIRLIKLYNEDSVIILHDGKTIKWMVYSNGFINKDIVERIPLMALSSKLTVENGYICNEISAEYWVKEAKEDLKCEEESLYLKKMKYYLTVLKFYST